MTKEISLENAIELQMLFGMRVSDRDAEDVDCKLPLYSEKDLNRAGISISGGDHATEK